MNEWSVALSIGLAVFGPLTAGVMIVFLPRSWAEPMSYLATMVAAVGTGSLLSPVLHGEAVDWPLFDLLPGVGIAFDVDPLGLTFGLLASGLWVLVNVFNSGYFRADNLAHPRRYRGSFATSIGSAVGIAFSGNLLTFLVFYELLTLATYPLVVHKQTDRAIAAGRRYLLFALSGGLSVTAGAVWLYRVTGSLDFIAGGLRECDAPPGTLLGIFSLLVAGCAAKAAIMPLHSWLPAAMVAPSPVSALLHAVAVVKAGVFGCLRVLGFVVGPAALSLSMAPTVLMAFCGATISIGSFVALRQNHLKRRLAYSTIVHLSYIVLGGALVSPHGMTGAVFHMVNHALCKITLFLCAGAIYATYHFETVDQLRGLGRKMPGTCGAFAVASLGLVGIPGFCGFISKVFLIRGAWQADEMVSMGIMLAGSLLTAAYLFPVVHTMFFDPPPTDSVESMHGEAHPTMLWPLVSTAALVVLFGLAPPVVNIQHALAIGVTKSVFIDDGPEHSTREARRERSALAREGHRGDT